MMIVNEETGVQGRANQARTLVCLREVQDLLLQMENKVDSFVYNQGMLEIERTELRKVCAML